MTTLLNRIKALPAWAGFIAAVIAILSTLFCVLVWFTIRVDRQVDKAVLQALEPYQHYLKGFALCQTQEHDLAVPELSKALQYMLEQNADKVTLVPVLDYYLDAIAYTVNPADYEPDFQLILKHLGKTAPIYAWHRDRIGWFYFRTSRIVPAKIEFQTSLSMRRGEGQTRNCAWTHWSLCLVHLATDDLEKAIEHACLAQEIGPEEYALENWAYNDRDFTRDFGVQGLVERYEPLKKNMPLFFARCRSLKKGSPSDRNKQ